MSVVHKQIGEIVVHMYVAHNMIKVLQSILCSPINKTCLFDYIKKEKLNLSLNYKLLAIIQNQTQPK